jgi:hypothetical protein
MSGGSGGPIIIWTLTFREPGYLPDATVARLRDIAERVNTTNRITLRERLFVALAAFVYLGNSAPYVQ